MPSNELYQALAARFDKHHKLPKGGADLDYISTEQCVSRLNEVLGVDGWEFEIREHGCENNTLWTLGRLTAHFPERTVAREQFGECATSRGMADGDARKGAGSDALKKCATLLGVALYLSDKDPASHRPAPREAVPARQAQATHLGTAPTGTGAASRASSTSAPAGGDYREPTEDEWIVWDDKVREQTGYSHGDVCALLGRSPSDHLRALNLSGTPKTGKALIADLIAYKREGRAIPGAAAKPAPTDGAVSEAVKALQDDIPNCEQCGQALSETVFRDGTRWEIAQLVALGQRKHGRVLCMNHYKNANQARLADAPVPDPVIA
jgi:hypothetical protein